MFKPPGWRCSIASFAHFRVVGSQTEGVDALVFVRTPAAKLAGEKEKNGYFEKRGRSPDGMVWGIIHGPQTPPPPSGIVMHVRGSLVRALVAQDSWLTKWLKREPIRPYRGR